MTGTWRRTFGVSAVSLALLGAASIGAPAAARAEVAVPDPVTTTTSTDAPMPDVDPTTGAATGVTTFPSTSPTTPRGCVGVTPKKPWRLVAARPNPNASEVRIEWAAVGCTTGYRVSIVGTGVDRRIDVDSGSASTTTVTDLSPNLTYRITVTSIGATGDGGVSGIFRLHRSGIATESDLTIDFPDAGPAEPVAPSANGTGPWADPELTWTPPVGQDPKGYRLRVTGSGGATVVEKTVAGTATKARLGDDVVAGMPYTVTLTPVMADGSDGDSSRLAFGNQQVPRPEQVTGNAPVVQFSPVSGLEKGRVLGYEIAYGALQASKHVFVPAASVAPSAPWVALDPTFATVDDSETAVPMKKMVAMVRTIATVGKSAWTPARTIAHSDVATPDAAFFAGIGHVGGEETVPRHGFLNVRGSVADVQVTDLVWSQSRRQQAMPVTVTVYGPDGSGSPAFTQDVPVTHLPDSAQDAWRASDIPLPDGWTSIVLRRGGVDVARWANAGGKACVAAVTYGDAPTDLPEMWKDSWCAA